MKTASTYVHWSEMRKQGIDILDVDDSLDPANRPFAGVDSFVEDVGPERMRAMDLVERVATGGPFEMDEALAMPRPFSVRCRSYATLDSLRIAAPQPAENATFLDEAWLFPALLENVAPEAACPAVRIWGVHEEPKSILARIEIHRLCDLLANPLQLSFNNSAQRQPWGRNLFAKGLDLLRATRTFTDPIMIELPRELQVKLLYLLMYPEFTAVPRVKLRLLGARFEEFSLGIQKDDGSSNKEADYNNIRDPFNRMKLQEVSSLVGEIQDPFAKKSMRHPSPAAVRLGKFRPA